MASHTIIQFEPQPPFDNKTLDLSLQTPKNPILIPKRKSGQKIF